MVLVLGWLLFGGLGLPLPEDVAVLSAGVLVHRGAVAWWIALPLVLAAVLAGDSILFLLARRLGPKALERPLFRRLLPPARHEHLEDLYRRYGGRLVFFARHVAGLRGAVFALAGMNRMKMRRFLAWDALAAVIGIPLTMAVGYFGSAHVDRVRAGVDRAEHWVALALALLGLAILALRHQRRLTRYNGQSRLQQELS